MKGASECPHCGAFGVVLNDDELRYVCGVCGGPRISIDAADVELSGHESEPLAKAQAGRKHRFLWRMGGVFGGLVGAFGLVTTAVMALLFEPGLIGAGLGIAAALPFLLLAFTAVGKSRARSEDIKRSLDQAWKSAARDIVLATPDGLTAKQLSEKLPVAENAAETILAELSVDDMLQSRITDEGRLRFTATPAARMRVEEAAAQSSKSADVARLGAAKTQLADPQAALQADGEDELEERFEALEEAMAAEQQAAAEASQSREKKAIK